MTATKLPKEKLTDDQLAELVADCDDKVTPWAPYQNLRIELALKELVAARALLKTISVQRPEKPDYWSECGQCGDNANRADEHLDEFARYQKWELAALAEDRA